MLPNTSQWVHILETISIFSFIFSQHSETPLCYHFTQDVARSHDFPRSIFCQVLKRRSAISALHYLRKRSVISCSYSPRTGLRLNTDVSACWWHCFKGQGYYSITDVSQRGLRCRMVKASFRWCCRIWVNSHRAACMALSISDSYPMFRAMAAFPWFYKKKTQGFLCLEAIGISCLCCYLAAQGHW